MTTARPGNTRDPDALYALLPPLYRARDRDEALRQYLALFARELDHVRDNIDQLWRDFYIDSAQDWVIPYIGDLLGTNLLTRTGAEQRADIKHSISLRRRKGTLAALEDGAAVTSGWGIVAVEMYDRLIWSQRLSHRRPHALHALRIADGNAVARVNTPFDASGRSVDLRPPDQRVGRHHIPHVALFEFAIASHGWRGVQPSSADGVRYRFHPIGVDTALYAGGDRGTLCDDVAPSARLRADICWPRANHVPIRGRDLADHRAKYVGVPSGFSIYEDGIPILERPAMGSSRSHRPAVDYADLDTTDGLIVADQTLFAAPMFRVHASRLVGLTKVVNGITLPVGYSPVTAWGNQFKVDPARFAGRVTASGFAYAAGVAYNPGAPDYEHRSLLLRVERTAAGADFPESEIIVRAADARTLLVFLPKVSALAVNASRYFYIADDGSTYHARLLHDDGDPNLNPDSGPFGALVPQHLARAALPQVRPRPGRPISYRRAVYRELCCWNRPVQPPLAVGDVAVDPARGRFRFPDGEKPAGRVTVDFRFARTGDLGAGPFFRGIADTPTRTVAKLGTADHRTIQSAIDASTGSAQHVIIEILDSSTYAENLAIKGNHPGGLTIRATRAARTAPLAYPCIAASAGSPAFHVRQAAVVGTGSRADALTLEGLVIGGGDLVVEGTVSGLVVRHCTLMPASVGITLTPAAALASVGIDHSITGPITADALVGRITIADSIVHEPAVTVEQPETSVAVTAVAVVVDRSTVLGSIDVDSVELSNALLLGAATIADLTRSCARFSRIPALGVMRAFRCTTAMPIFVSLDAAHAGYAHLHPNTSEPLRRGGEEGSEMGAFYGAALPWREQNLALRVAEFLPAGLRAVTVRALPAARFAGVRS